jgi:hypothetical protein
MRRLGYPRRFFVDPIRIGLLNRNDEDDAHHNRTDDRADARRVRARVHDHTNYALILPEFTDR